MGLSVYLPLGHANIGSDEYCPHCDNHFVIDAVTPKPALHVEGDDARVDSRYFLLCGCSGCCLRSAECSKMIVSGTKNRRLFSMLGMRRIDWVDWGIYILIVMKI